jgi:foldase protein PrsA
MKKILTVSALLIALSAPLAAQERTERLSLPDVASEVVARVNGRDLTRDELAALAVAVYGSQVLETLISQEVVRQEAERQGVTVTQAQIDEYVGQRVQQYLDGVARKAGAKDVAELAARAGEPADAVARMRARAETALRPFVEPELLAMKLMAREITITDDEVRTEYNRQYGAKAKVLQIVLGTKAEAQSVIEKLRMGADFKQLAQEVSKDPVSRRNGGEMSPLPVTSLLGSAASKLKPGEISEPVQSPDGFHVLKLVEMVPASETAFEDVKDALRDGLFERRIGERKDRWLGDLVSRADVTRMFQVPTP